MRTTAVVLVTALLACASAGCGDGKNANTTFESVGTKIGAASGDPVPTKEPTPGPIFESRTTPADKTEAAPREKTSTTPGEKAPLTLPAPKSDGVGGATDAKP